MATITNVRNNFRIKLNGGSTSSGNVKEISVSFPKTEMAADLDGVMAVAEDYENVSEYNIYSVENTIVDYLS